MTRKRFIKQLMALGVQRNAANAAAWLHRMQGHTYRRALGEERLRLSLKKAMGTFGTVAGEMTKAIAALADQVKKNFRAINFGLERNVIHHPTPYTPGQLSQDFQNVQVMSHADHAALHGGGGND